MAVNPSETPEHPTGQHSEEQDNAQSSHEAGRSAEFSEVPPHYPEEPRSATESSGSGAESSWSDTNWSGVQPNQTRIPPDVSVTNPHHSGHPKQGPDSLRGRADSLLDEMMLGAVDLSAGGPTGNGHFDPAQANQPPANSYEQAQPPQIQPPQVQPPQIQPPQVQPPQADLSNEYMADLGGPANVSTTNVNNQAVNNQAANNLAASNPAQVPNTTQDQSQPQGFDAAQPAAYPPINQPQPDNASQTPRSRYDQSEQPAYPTVSQEMSNQPYSDTYQGDTPAGNASSGYTSGTNPIYGQQPAHGQQPSLPQGQLYPPSSGAAQDYGQPPAQPPAQPAPRPSTNQQLPPTMSGAPYESGAPYDQSSDLRPPSVSTPDAYQASQPPRSSFSYPGASTPSQQSGGYSFDGPSSTELSGMSYFEQQRLSYAERYAFEREQERKQWSIATGKANDYLTSVPRYPRESRDELGQPSNSPYNPASSQPPQSQYPPGQYPPAPNPAAYPSGQYPPGQYPSGQHQQPYPQQPSPYPNAQPPQQYQAPQYQPQQHQPQQQYQPQQQVQQGQYAQPAGYPPNAPPSYQGHIPELGPVVSGQQRTSPFADAMSVGSQARQMDLLPRETKMNVQALQEEMLSLHSNIDTSLPIGHDTADRARHLLDKGRAILEQDPYRSAEVSYYVQQVKAILDRAKQRTKWSNMYRTRLLYYLLGWFFLSITALASVMIYSDQLRAFFAPSGVSPNDTILGQHGVPFLATIAAGTLGASIAALLNMWRYSQRDYGFFDRKYGLLGVVLPIISLLFGTVVYLIFGFIAELFNIPPSSNLLISVVPAVIAFAFGAAQERIYGTSE